MREFQRKINGWIQVTTTKIKVELWDERHSSDITNRMGYIYWTSGTSAQSPVCVSWPVYFFSDVLLSLTNICFCFSRMRQVTARVTCHWTANRIMIWFKPNKNLTAFTSFSKDPSLHVTPGTTLSRWVTSVCVLCRKGGSVILMKAFYFFSLLKGSLVFFSRSGTCFKWAWFSPVGHFIHLQCAN